MASSLLLKKIGGNELLHLVDVNRCCLPGSGHPVTALCGTSVSFRRSGEFGQGGRPTPVCPDCSLVASGKPLPITTIRCLVGRGITDAVGSNNSAIVADTSNNSASG